MTDHSKNLSIWSNGKVEFIAKDGDWYLGIFASNLFREGTPGLVYIPGLDLDPRIFHSIPSKCLFIQPNRNVNFDFSYYCDSEGKFKGILPPDYLMLMLKLLARTHYDRNGTT